MPKIIFDDEPANEITRKLGGKLVVGFLIFSFLMGLIGGAGSIMLVSGNAKLRQILGVTDTSPLNLTRTVSEKLVVEESNGFIQTVKKVSPAVVSITTKTQATTFFGQTVEQEGDGTGFIITSDGLIVTNKHVVGDEKSTYTVFTSDGKTYDATVKARDPFNDLAILKIEATGLPVVELGDSDALEVGQWVTAIGNALGQFNNSVSVGVVSAKNRKLDTGAGSAELTGLVQTDAAINPGNSGGPLVNLKGQVIGINTAIASTTGSSIGIGFAIPVNSVKKAIESVRKTGKIERPMLGVRYINITAAVQKQLDLKVDHGALVAGDVQSPGLVAGGPADQAGVQERDIILEINGERLDEDHPLSNLLVKYSPGDTITLRVMRKDKEQDISVKLTELKE
jgi:serine protease Do